MGNAFSRKLEPKERLFALEKEVDQLEKRVASLKKGGTPFFSTPNLLFVSFVIGTGAILWYDKPIGMAVLALGTIQFSWLISSLWRSFFLRKAVARLAKLHTELNSLVNMLRNDEVFARTRHLIDKYDDVECKESFFRRIKKKRLDSMEKLAEYVLGNDPSRMNALICKKCGLHNGLIDPENSDFPYFYCYSCNERNIRAKADGP